MRDREHHVSNARPSEAEPIYYQLNTSRMRFAELRRLSSHPIVLATLCLRKVLRWRWYMVRGFAPLKRNRINFESFPLHAQQALAGPLRECAQLGFLPWAASSNPTLGQEPAFTVALADAGGTVAAAVTFSKLAFGPVQTTRKSVCFLSALQDSRVISTIDVEPVFDDPPTSLSEYHPGMSVSDLYARHAARLATAGRDAVIAMDASARETFYKEHARRNLDFQCQRGIWVPMSAAEIEQQQAASSAANA